MAQFSVCSERHDVSHIIINPFGSSVSHIQNHKHNDSFKYYMGKDCP